MWAVRGEQSWGRGLWRGGAAFTRERARGAAWGLVDSEGDSGHEGEPVWCRGCRFRRPGIQGGGPGRV